MSSSLRVLVVEDDFFVAEKLVQEIHEIGDVAVGPFADVHDAIHRAGLVQAAILDVRVQDETSFLVADSLIHHDVPFVFLTGYDPQVVPPRFSRRHVYTKPSHAAPLLHDLHEQHRAAVCHESPSVEDIVREMIRRAQDVMPDGPSADRLVEAALLRAITQTGKGRMIGDIRGQLLVLLEEEYRTRGKLHLQ